MIKRLRFLIKKIEGKEVKYEFVSGVYNTRRGYDGFHSVAYVRNKGEKVLCYNDERVWEQEETRGYPKLLFYKKGAEFSGDQMRQRYDI